MQQIWSSLWLSLQYGLHVAKLSLRSYMLLFMYRIITQKTFVNNLLMQRTKPLKMIMSEAKNQADQIKPTNFNIDVILDIMNSSKKSTLDVNK